MTRASPRVFALSAAAVVIAALAMGLAVTGTPGKARKLRFDQMRTSDLMTLSDRLETYVQSHGKLPAALSATAGTRTPVHDHDRQSGAPYEFIVKGDNAYALCANFALASTEADDLPPQAAEPGGAHGRWDHPAGRRCFDFTVEGTKDR
jgi:hypothetical protein